MLFIFETKYHELERRILIRTLVASVGAILFYIGYDFWVGNFTEQLFSGIVGLIAYTIGLFVTLRVKDLRFVIRFNSILFTGSMIGSFFATNGFNGSFLFDFINYFLCVGIILSGKTRVAGIVVSLFLMIFFIYIQVEKPTLISNIREGDSYFVFIFFIFLRFMLTLSLGIAVRDEYVRDKNTISRMNIDLYEKNQEIRSINEKLEILVDLRSKELLSKNQKLMEVAYFNAHNVRGPLARMMGLVYLMRKSKNESSEWQEYLDNLDESSQELDKMIKNIHEVLAEVVIKTTRTEGENQN